MSFVKSISISAVLAVIALATSSSSHLYRAEAQVNLIAKGTLTASSAGEYTFSLFAVVAIALIVSWFVAVIFAPLLGVAVLKPPTTGQSADPGRVFRWYRGFLTLAMRARWMRRVTSISKAGGKK